MQPKSAAARSRIRRAARPRRLTMEWLETRQLLSLSPAFAGMLVERPGRIGPVAEVAFHGTSASALVSTGPDVRTARPLALAEAAQTPRAEFAPHEPVVFMPAPSRPAGAPALGADARLGRDSLLPHVPELEGEAPGHAPPAFGATLEWTVPLSPARYLTIEVVHPAAGVPASYSTAPPGPIASAPLMTLTPPPALAPPLAMPAPTEAARAAPEAPSLGPSALPTPQTRASERSLSSPLANVKSPPPSTVAGREVATSLVDSLNASAASAPSQVAALFDAPDVTRSIGQGWQLQNVETPPLANAAAMRNEPSTERISPRTEEGFVDLQTIKSRDTAAILVTGDLSFPSAARDLRAGEPNSQTALAADLSWRLLTLHRWDTAGDQEGDRADGESGAQGLASSDLALSVEVLQVRRLELPDGFEDGGMVVIEAPAMASLRAACPTDEALAVGPRPATGAHAVGNGVKMDAVCGRVQALEVFGANSTGDGSAVDRWTAHAPAAAPGTDKVFSSTSPAVSSAEAVGDAQAAAPNRAGVLPLLLALIPQLLAERRRRKVATTPETAASLPTSRPRGLGFPRWLRPPW